MSTNEQDNNNKFNRITSDEQFLIKVFGKYGTEYRPLDKYLNSRTKIRVFHENCGQIILKRPNDLLNGYGCNECNKHRKMDNTMFLERLDNIYDGEYIALEEYVDSHTDIHFKHICGTVFKTKPCRLIHHQRKCPKCKQNPTPTETEVKEMIKTCKGGDEYLLVSDYEKMHKRAKFLHIKCGETFMMKPTEFIRSGKRCSHCSGVRKYTTETFKDKVLKITNGYYLVLGDYVNNKTKIKMKHLKCGNVWDVRPDCFLHGSRCPECSRSRGNRIIRRYLEMNNIVFRQEYRINECKNKRMLPFDFAVFNSNNELLLLIEFQGKQHYEVVEKFGGEKGLKERQRNDRIKAKFCNDNNIELLEIRYTEIKNIDSVLKQKLRTYGLM